LVIIINYVRKGNKKPEGFENIPFISALPVAWAYLRQKNYDEVGDLIHKLSGGHEIYLVIISHDKQTHIEKIILNLFY
jgi:hypothetical protein